MFEIGQLVTVRVTDASNRILELSMNPSDINRDLIHNKIIEGFILTCAIEEIESHGYIIDTGIPNLRAFLPKSDEENYEYTDGQIISCIVESIECSQSASIAKLRSVNKFTRRNEENITIAQMLMPQNIVKFKIEKIVKGILTGTICNGTFSAAVLTHHLEKSVTSPSDYTVGLEIDAKIVCIMSLSKMVYLTLHLKKFPHLKTPGIPEIGKIIKDAEVMRQTESFVELKFKKKYKAILNRQSKNDEIFNPGQKIKIKLLEYNVFDRVYLCSNDKRLLTEHDYTIDKLKVGEVVDFVVNSVNKEGITGFIGVYGNLKSFIQNIDVSMHDVQKNDIIPVKIIAISQNGKVNVTNRVEYITAKKKIHILMDQNDAKVGDIFTGTVLNEYDKFYLVRFFNQIAGSITKTPITESKLKVGKITNFTIKEIRDDVNNEGRKKIYLSLPVDSDYDDRLGEIMIAKVKSHIPTGVNIKLNDKTNGFISNLAFAQYPEVSQIICKSLKEGDEITCVCIGRGIFSVRCVEYYKKHSIKNINELQRNEIVRSYVKNIVNNEVQLYLPIKGLSNDVKIPLSTFIENRHLLNKFELVPEQIVHLKITKIKGNSLSCSPKLSEVWNYDFKSAIQFFMLYLQEHEKLRKSLPRKKDKIATLKVGNSTEAVVTEINSVTRDIYLDLGNNIKGILRNDLYLEKPKIGDTIQAKILWIDYIKREVDLQTKYHSSIAIEVAESEIETHKGVIIFERENFILALLKGSHLPVLIPKHVHFNDFFSIIKSYSSHKNAKLLILKNYMGYIIATFAEFYFIQNSFKLVNVKVNERKRKISDSNSTTNDADLMTKLRLIKKKKEETEEGNLVSEVEQSNSEGESEEQSDLEGEPEEQTDSEQESKQEDIEEEEELEKQEGSEDDDSEEEDIEMESNND